MDLDVQAELTRLRSQFPGLNWSYCIDDNGTLVPPTWPPEVPLAAPPLRTKPPPTTNVPRRGGGHGKTRDMCYVRRATALPPPARPRLSACNRHGSVQRARARLPHPLAVADVRGADLRRPLQDLRRRRPVRRRQFSGPGSLRRVEALDGRDVRWPAVLSRLAMVGRPLVHRRPSSARRRYAGAR